MTPSEQLTLKRALEVLDSVEAGLPLPALMDQVERMTAHPLTTLERERAIATLLAKNWVKSYRCTFTDRILYVPTDSGRMAMIAL